MSLNFGSALPTVVAGVYVTLVDAQGHHSAPMTALFQTGGAMALEALPDTKEASHNDALFEFIGLDRLREPTR